MTEEETYIRYKYSNTIGKTLKSLRTFHQLTQSELARKAKICCSMIGEIECLRRPLSAFALMRYLSAFSITAQELAVLHKAAHGKDGIDFGLLQAFLDMKKP